MNEFKFALKQTFPIFFTYVFIGIAFGILMTEAGYTAMDSLLCAIVIFAGSMQIVMVPMLQSGVSLATMAVMTFFINGRHLFYGVGFIDRFRKAGWRYPYMVFSLTDETYSILCSVQYPDGIDQAQADFLIALMNHSYWILGCLMGSCAGRLLPFDLTGIDFSATAFFLVIVLNQLKQYRSKLPVSIGLLSALFFYFLLGPEYFLIPTLSLTFIVLILFKGKISKDAGISYE